jgi:hypothetical protein
MKLMVGFSAAGTEVERRHGITNPTVIDQSWSQSTKEQGGP